MSEARKTASVFGVFIMLFLLMFPFIPAKAEEDPVSVVYRRNGEKICGENEGEYRNWGSMSTLFIWIGIMQLKEEGLIDLNDPVSEHLPDEISEAADFPYSFTVLDLMNQTAGFQNENNGRFLLEDQTIDSLYSVLKSTIPPQINEPGEYVVFSDWGCLLCAYLIESKSGIDYVDYVEEHILEPLEMTDTSVAYDHSDNPDVAGTSDRPGVLSAFFPVYSARGTVDDMDKLLADLTSGESKLLNPETADELFSSSLKYRNLSDPRIAHGLAYYYEYEKPVIGIRGYSYMGSQELYISEDRSEYYIRVIDSASAPFSVNDDSENSPAAFFGTRQKQEGPFRNSLSDMEGWYVKADASLKGVGRVVSFIDTYHFVKAGENALSVSKASRTPFLTQISENTFITSQGEVGYFLVSGSKNSLIEYPMQDLLIYPKGLLNLQRIVLLLYYLGIVYSVNALAVAFIVFLYRIIKKKEHTPVRFRKYHFIQCACFMFHGVFFHIMAFSYISGFDFHIGNSSMLMYYFSIILSFVYLLFFGKTGFKEECGKFEKALFFTTGIFSVVLIVFNFAFGLVLRG